jgi:hypothetical protein
MTPQEIFDKALSGVLKQGEPALKRDRSCDYYTESGKMCAVGLLLGPELAQQWSKASVGEVADVTDTRIYDVVVPDWVKANMDLLMGIQSAHDVFLNGDQELDLEVWKGVFLRKMRSLAFNHNLDYKKELEHV